MNINLHILIGGRNRVAMITRIFPSTNVEVTGHGAFIGKTIEPFADLSYGHRATTVSFRNISRSLHETPQDDRGELCEKY